jgi:hypothetical protein
MTLALTVMGTRALHAQISPGPLARPHAALEGATKCSQCHGGRNEPTTQRCLACHREIAWLRQQSRGYHARGDGRGACSSCHPDHAGRDFQLIQWPEGTPERFDHGRAGYVLEQSHASAKCTACHTARLRLSPAAKLSPRRSAAGWVGLERDCVSCHNDPHRGSLTGECTRCHDAGRWKDAPRFDHARTDYPLTGKHADVPCAKCHLAARLRPPVDSAGRPTPVFRPVSFKDCSSCHANPHQGRLTGACTTCHVTSSFKTIDRAGFDHDRTRYPLRGRHAAVACGSCHVGTGPAAARPAFATCATCHRDPHAGEATIAGKAVDCAACHRVDGFATPTFTVEQHRATAFPLAGRHASVPCSGCHSAKPGTRQVIPIRVASRQCTDCHANAHGTQLAARADSGACNACHSVDGWRPATFGVAAHASTRLPLDGAHASVRCAACHATNRPGLRSLGTVAAGSAHVVVRPPELTCAECHADPHEWRSPNVAAPPCTACHSTRAFRPTTMDAAAHARAGYPLEGAHRAVPCVSCHKESDRPRPTSTLVAATPRVSPLRLGSAPTTCAACHADPHGGRFDAAGRAGCETCHTLGSFKPASRFDHARIARFPLEGAHQRVACASCHRQPPGAKPGAPLVYAGLSAKCESCHVTDTRRPRGPA